ncbi:MAG: Na+-dependent transporter [Candidatus Methanoplasma sp.]|jgi:BASS family bile acid:Na+ symporter|nr:Na+-dependent transporter [Candidatus Methanoplasma sp.]
MALLNILTNVRIWVALGIVCALAIGPLGPQTPTLVIAVLIVQMTFSMEGVSFRKADFIDNRQIVLISTAICLVVGAGSCLLFGLLFKSSNPEVWQGWALLAAMPCAVSSVALSLFCRGNGKASIICLTTIYLLALATTPILSFFLLGDAVSPLQVFKYLILFIAVPLLINIPLGKVKIDRRFRVSVINIMIFFLILLSLGYNRGYVLGDPWTVMLILACNAVRIFGLGFAVLFISKRYGFDRSKALICLPVSVWRNSGLAMSLSMVLLLDAPEAVLPAVTSIVVEMVWFAVIIDHVNKRWPAEDAVGASVG